MLFFCQKFASVLSFTLFQSLHTSIFSPLVALHYSSNELVQQVSGSVDVIESSPLVRWPEVCARCYHTSGGGGQPIDTSPTYNRYPPTYNALSSPLYLQSGEGAHPIDTPLTYNGALLEAFNYTYSDDGLASHWWWDWTPIRWPGPFTHIQTQLHILWWCPALMMVATN